MKRIERLEKAIHDVPASAGEVVAALLAHITHDVNGALSTFVMEVYSLQGRRQKIAKALAQGAAVDELFGQLDASLANLRKTASELTAYVGRVEEAVAAMRGRAEQHEGSEP